MSLPALQSPSFPKPWLIINPNTMETLCHKAISNDSEGCALEVLTMDMDFFCNATDNDGSGVLYHATARGFSNFVLKILRSTTTVTYSGFKGATPLHLVTRCSATTNFGGVVDCGAAGGSVRLLSPQRTLVSPQPLDLRVQNRVPAKKDRRRTARDEGREGEASA
ncbi:uncharacterized protein [Spinacia oleracea]|uniref:Uncharacterized protein isoform X2 n=1 Tax=Spinacia oleracea TaxID=3562 RepID=A0A9R0KD23_SPIOL|nr:uncharacterized protein LOC110805846 isoform X2 [Spinacia oleracea]